MMSITYWRVFRLVFVSLFFYNAYVLLVLRDGTTYYFAIFGEFLPTAALLTLLLNIVAISLSVLVWVLLNLFGWFSRKMGWEVKIEQCLLFIGISVLTVAVIWILKHHVVSVYAMSSIEKLITVLSAGLVAVFISWKFHDQAESWMRTVQKRIAHLVFLYGVVSVLSVLLVVYKLLG